MDFEQILAISGLYIAFSELNQAYDLHRETLNQENELHKIEMNRMKEEFEHELDISRRTYLLSTYTDLEKFFQELNENLINSTRDSERDMVDQRNQQFQTILIASTIMLTALLSVLFQGSLPDGTSEIYLILYSLFNSLSLIILSACVALCVEIMNRVTRFMYNKSFTNIDHMTKAISQTKNVMQELRNSLNLLLAYDTNKNEVGDTENINNQFNTSKNKDFERNSNVQTSSPFNIDNAWENHQSTLYQYLQKRNILYEKLEELHVKRMQTDNKTNKKHPNPLGKKDFSLQDISESSNNDIKVKRKYHQTFESYWNTYCRFIGNSALITFYIGTFFMLMATMVFMWVYFHKNYHSSISAISSVVTLGVSMIFSLMLAIYLRFHDKQLIAFMNTQESDDSPVSTRSFYKYFDSNSFFNKAKRNQKVFQVPSNENLNDLNLVDKNL